jgi:hypothetical protein
MDAILLSRAEAGKCLPGRCLAMGMRHNINSFEYMDFSFKKLGDVI